MKDIYLVTYSVKGIKTIDELVSLSFYKKTIQRDMNTQKYNIKGIYGMNGSGKSGIITSVEILKNLLIDSEYLNNPIAQKNLDAIINKKIGELFIEADYIIKDGEKLYFFKYTIKLTRDVTGKYIISYECLATKNAISKKESMDILFEVVHGELVSIYEEERKSKLGIEIFNKTINLLATASMCSLFWKKFVILETCEKKKNFLCFSMNKLYSFGKELYVYLDASDNHREYVAQNSMEYDSVKDNLLQMNNDCINVISITENIVPKSRYKYFEESISKLYEFLHIFKSDLQGVEINRKENRNFWICDLIMVYDSYKIHAEFESTGIKKLIKLFAYLKEMVRGGIVFIDEFDSNLHDVYLCALLEYLMEYGKGQLCFTTHNVGPMDVLKQHKKSIDFLSEDHKIYPWTKNGNYSPSKLYRNGMIEGSPFNVDSIDFIGVFGLSEEEE